MINKSGRGLLRGAALALVAVLAPGAVLAPITGAHTSAGESIGASAHTSAGKSAGTGAHTSAGKRAGTGTVTVAPMVSADLRPEVSVCAATLAEVATRVPVPTVTRWVFADLGGLAGGYYFPGENVIAIEADMACGWLPYAAAHELMHQYQDLSGLWDPTEVGGMPMTELVADCAARSIVAAHGWPAARSYADHAGVDCASLATPVARLLSQI